MPMKLTEISSVAIINFIYMYGTWNAIIVHKESQKFVFKRRGNWNLSCFRIFTTTSKVGVFTASTVFISSFYFALKREFEELTIYGQGSCVYSVKIWA